MPKRPYVVMRAIVGCLIVILMQLTQKSLFAQCSDPSIVDQTINFAAGQCEDFDFNGLSSENAGHDFGVPNVYVGTDYDAQFGWNPTALNCQPNTQDGNQFALWQTSGEDYVFEIVVPAGQSTSLDILVSSSDERLSVYLLNDCSASDCFLGFGWDNGSPSGSAEVPLTNITLPAGTYYLVVDNGEYPNDCCGFPDHNGWVDFDVSISAATAPSITGPGTVCVTADPISLSGGSPSGGTYVLATHNANLGYFNPDEPGTAELAGDVLDPTVFGPGDYYLTYVYEINGESCASHATDPVTILPAPLVLDIDYHYCDEDDDGDAVFLLDEIDDLIDVEGGNSVSYHGSQTNAESGSAPLNNGYEYGGGTIFARVEGSNGCYTVAEVNLIVDPTAFASDAELTTCDDGSGLQLFSLPYAEDDIAGAQTDINITYHLSQSDAQSYDPSSNTPPAAETPYASNGEVLYARLENDAGCFAISTLTLTVFDTPAATSEEYVVCSSSAATESFDLNAIEADVLNGQAGLTVSFHTLLSEASDENTPNPLSSPYDTAGDLIFARVENADGCFAISEISLMVRANPTANIQYVEACDDGNGMGTFYLPNNDNLVDPSTIHNVTYHPTAGDAQNGTNALADYHYSAGETLYTRVETDAGCFSTSTITLVMHDLPSVNDASLAACANSNGTVDFLFNDALNDLIGTQTNLDISYHMTQANADSYDPNSNTPQALLSPFTTAGQTVYVRVSTQEGCVAMSELTLTVYPTIPANDIELSICTDGVSPGDFDLNDALPLVTGNPGSLDISFHGTALDAFNDGNEISNTSSYSSLGEQLFLRMESPDGCMNFATVTLATYLAPSAANAEMKECEEPDGTAEFNLTQTAGAVAAGQDEVTIAYYETLADAESGSNPLSSPYISGAATIYAVVSAGDGCTALSEIELIPDNEVTVPGVALYECDSDGNGTEDFDLNDAIDLIDPDGTGTVTLHLTETDAENNVNPIPTSDYQVSTAGDTYYFSIVTDDGCIGQGAVELVMTEIPLLNSPVTIESCSNYTGYAQFNLQSTIADIAGTGAAGLSFSFHSNLVNAQAFDPLIQWPTPLPNIYETTASSIYARVSTAGGCVEYAEVILDVNSQPQVYAAVLGECNDGDGIIAFDLTQADDLIHADPNNIVSYHETEGNAQLNHNPITGTYDAVDGSVVFARVESTDGCVSVQAITLLVYAPPMTNDDVLRFCDNNAAVFPFHVYYSDNRVDPTGNQVVTYHYTEAGAASGADEIPTPANTPGSVYEGSSGDIVYARVENSFGCYSIAEVTLELLDAPDIDASTFEVCDDGDGYVSYSLPEAIPIVDGNPDNFVSFHPTMNDAIANTATLSSPYFASHGDVIFFRSIGPNGCVLFDELTLEVNGGPGAANETLYECEEDDGVVNFDLSNADNLVDVTGGNDVEYFLSLTAANNGTDPLPQQFEASEGTVIYARVQGGPQNCFSTSELTLSFYSTPPSSDTELFGCITIAGEPVHTFNLAQSSAAVDPGGESNVTFYETLNDAESASDPIGNVITAQSGTEVFARVEDNHGCYNTAVVLLTTEFNPQVTSVEMIECALGLESPNGNFNLNDIADQADIEGGNTVTFYNSAGGAYSGGEPINPVATLPTGITFGRVEDAYGCFDIFKVQTTVVPLPQPHNSNIEVCDDGSGNLEVSLNQAIGLVDPTGTFYVDFFETNQDAEAGSNMLSSPYETTAGSTVFARLENDYGCYNIAQLSISAISIPEIEDVVLEACANGGGSFDFDLDQLAIDLLPAGGVNITFHASDEDANNYDDMLNLPQALVSPYSSSGEESIFARVPFSDNCVSVVEVPISVFDQPSIEPASGSACVDSDGNAVFDLNEIAAELLPEGSSNIITFHSSQEEADTYDPDTDSPAALGETYSISADDDFYIRLQTPDGCAAITTFTPSLLDQPVAENATESACADENGEATFDLSSFELSDPTVEGQSVSYYASQEDADLGDNELAAEFITTGETIFFKVENVDGCSAIAELELVVNEALIVEDQSLESCDDDSDGLASFDFELVNAEIDPDGDWTIAYFESLEDAENGDNELTSPYDSEAATLTISVLDANGCLAIAELDLMPLASPSLLSVEELCNEAADAFVLTVELEGGDATTYAELTGSISGTWDGNIFTSEELVSGTEYNLEFGDDFACDVVELLVDHTCECLTDAGLFDSGPFAACEDGDITVLAPDDLTTDANDIIQFVLHSNETFDPSEIIIQNDDGLFSYDDTILNLDETYYVSILVGNDNAGDIDLDDPCLSVSASQELSFSALPTPSVLNDEQACGLIATLEVENVSGSGVWTDENGDTIIDDDTALSTSVEVPDYGDYTFTYTETNNDCEGIATTTISFFEAPVVDTYETVCDDSAISFIVTFEILGGDAATLTVDGSHPGLVDGNLFTSDPINSGESFEFNISDDFICDPIQITDDHTCECQTDAGTNVNTPQDVCVDEEVVLTIPDDLVADSNDLGTFIMHASEQFDAAEIIQESDTGEFIYDDTILSAGETYYVSYVLASDDGLGNLDYTDLCLDYTESTALVFNALPEPSINNGDTNCGLSVELIAENVNGTGVWTDDTGNAVFADATSGTTLVDVPDFGSYEFTFTEILNGCEASASQSINFIDAPIVSDYDMECNDAADSFIVTFEILGGDAATLSVDGTYPGLVVGNIFTSDPIPSGETFTYTITDDNDCDPQEITDTQLCACVTDAGTLLGDPIVLCADESADLVVPADAVLDSNDLGMFVVHDGDALNIGNILSESINTNILFDEAIFQYGTVYQVTYVVASDDGTGAIDWTDACLSSSNALSVEFNEIPVLDAGPNELLCAMEYQLALQGSLGIGQWSATGPGQTTFNNETLADAMVSVDTPGEYSFTWEENNNGCLASATTTIEFNEPLQIITNAAECSADGLTFTLTIGLSGGDGNYVINGVTGTTTGDSFVSDPMPSGTEYTLDVSDGSICDPIQLTGSHECDCVYPVPVAGDAAASCLLDYQLQAVPSTGTGQWSFTGPGNATFDDPTSPTAIATVDLTGDYSFIWEETNNGCSDSDEVIISFMEPLSSTEVMYECNADNTAYTLSFDLAGGDGTYVVDGILGTLNGYNFVSNEILSGEAVSFSVSSADCTPLNIDATHACECDTPTAEAGDDDTTCELVYNLQGVPSLGTGLWTFTGPGNATFSDATSATSTVSVDLPGAYQFTWTETNDGCTDADTIEINFLEPLNALVIDKQCDAANENYTIQLTISGGDGVYVVTGVTGAVTGSDFISDPIPSGTEVTATVSDGSACVDFILTDTHSCECDEPTAEAGEDDTTCELVYNLQGVPSLGTGLWTFTGPGNATFSDATSATSTVSVDLLGAYQFTWTETNDGCTNAETIVINFLEPLSAVVIDKQCDATNENYTIQLTISGGDGVYAVTGVTGTVTGSDFISDPIPSGTEVTATVSDGSECLDFILTDTHSCECDTPTAEAGEDDTTCELVYNLQGVPSLGTGLWTFTGPGNATFSDATSATSTVSVDLPGAYQFTWTETNDGCTNAETIVINFLEPLSAVVIDKQCDATNENYTIQFTISGGDGVYVVTGVTGTVTGSDFISDPIPSGTEVTATVSDGSACLDFILTDTHSCECDEPTAEAGENDTTCELVYNLQGVPSLGTGLWTFTGPGNATFIDATSATSTVSVDLPGAYQFTWTETNDGCTNADTIVINFLEPLNAVVIDKQCDATNENYTIQLTISGGDGVYAVTGVTGTVTGSDFVSDPIPSGTEVTATVSDGSACLDFILTDTHSCECDEPTAEAGENDTTCELVYNLQGVPSLGTGLWTFTGPGNATFSDATSATSTVSVDLPGEYQLTWTETNDGCTNADTIVINFLEPLNAVVIDKQCDATNENYTIQLTISGGDGVYAVTGVTGTVTGSDFISDPIPSGTEVTATVSDGSECLDFVLTDTHTCECVDPVADAGENETICGTSLTLSAVPSIGEGTWTYDGPGGLGIADPSNPNTEITAASPGVYSLTWTENNNDCTDSDQIDVEFVQPLEVYNLNKECSADNNTFIVSFEVVGGTNDHIVSGSINGAWNGDVYFSDPIPSGSSFSFNVSDGSDCADVLIDDIHTCDCVEPDAFAGDDDSVCAYTYDLAAVPSVGEGYWSYDGTENVSFADVNDPNTTVTVEFPGFYDFFWNESNEGCTDSDKVNIAFIEPINVQNVTHDCLPDASAYTVSFEVNGSEGNYIISHGGSWTGAVYTTDPIQSGTSYNIQIIDNGPCADFNFSDTYSCDCESPTPDAGSDNTVCEYNYQLQAIASLGTGEWTADGPGVASFDDLSNPQANVAVDQPGTYSFTWTETNQGCTDSDIVEVIFEQPITISNLMAECSDDAATYIVSFTIDGGDGSYDIIGNTGNWEGMYFVSDPINSGEAYSFDVNDETICEPVIISDTFECDCVNPTPDAGADDTVCSFEYTLQAIPSVESGNWAFNGGPADAIFDDATNPNAVVTLSEAGEYAFIWTEDDNGCSAFDEVLINIQQPITISNILTECTSDETTYTVSFQIDGGDGNYTINGSVGGSWQGSVYTTEEILSGETYTYQVVDSSDCPELSDSVLAQCDCTLPIADAGEPGSTCGLTYQLSAQPSVGEGIWIADGPGTIAFDDSNSPNAIVTVSQSGSYIFTWTEDNQGCVSNDEVPVVFYDELSIEVFEELCEDAGDYYVVSFEIAGGNGGYSVAGAGTLTDYTFVSDPILSGNAYTFEVSDAGPCPPVSTNGTFTCPEVISECTLQAGNLSDELGNYCVNQAAEIEVPSDASTLTPDQFGLFYLLENPNDDLNTALETSETGVFLFSANLEIETTYYVVYAVGSDAGGTVDLNDECLDISTALPISFYPEIDDAIIDADTTCGLTYSFDVATTIPANGSWTGTGAGGFTFVDANSLNSEVTVSAPGVYNFLWVSDYYPCTFSEEIEITFYDSPELINVETLCNSLGTSYTLTVELSGGDQSTYEAYGLIAGTWDGAIFTSAEIPSGSDYELVFQDVNACENIEVSGTLNCDCLSNAGTIEATPQELCEAQTFSANLISEGNLDDNDTAIYFLHDGPELLTSNIVDQNETGAFDFTANSLNYEITYYVSYVVGNANADGIDFDHECTSFTQAQAFTFSATPIIDAGDDQVNCSLIANLNASLNSGIGVWSYDGPGTVSFNDQNDPATILEVSESGEYTLTWTVSNGECESTDTVLLAFQEGFSASLDDISCNDDASFYFVSIIVNGIEDSELIVSGSTMGVMDNGIFTTDPIPSGESYNIELSSTNSECEAQLFEGQFSCDCTTQLGNMSDETLHLCDGENAVSSFTDLENADADDVAFYVLHDGGPFYLGNILDQNQTGVFEYDESYTEDESYFIAYVLGNASGDFVDLDDDCTAISNGQPVIWHGIPEVSVVADGLINCEDEVVGLQANASTNYAKYYWEGPGINQINANDQNPSVDVPGDYYVTVLDTVTYCMSEEAHLAIDLVINDQLTATVDVNDPLCPGDNSGSVSLLEVTDNAEYGITLNGVAISEEFDWDNLVANEYTLTIEDIQGCAWDTIIVVQDPQPISIDLGPDIYIEPGESVQLSIDADFVIEAAAWDDAPSISCIDCETPLVSPEQTTTYTATALNDLGCSDEDSVTVFVEYPSQSVVIPTAFSPNGDALNDVVTILSLDGGDHTVLEFLIYDRWGSLVFENYDFPPNDHSNGWNGTIRGEEAEISVYVYSAKVLLESGRIKKLKGNVTLIR